MFVPENRAQDALFGQVARCLLPCFGAHQVFMRNDCTVMVQLADASRR
jgi:hypothetical protein